MDERVDGWAALLRHERIPFVSYPYEWPFSMLREAALLHLELLLAALEEDLTLKDASPYNVQWRGAQPVFIDVGSFERLSPGEPWAGYRQFCSLMLYPLLLRALRDVPYAPWLRGSIDGISPQQCRNLLSFRDRLRRGVFTHVTLHARLERRYTGPHRDVKGELKKAGFRKEIVAANVRGLERLVRGLEWRGSSAAWGDYGVTNTYAAQDAERKAAFVRSAAQALRPSLVWDLGCNDGTYSRVAAAHADHVVAIDADEAVADRLYRELHTERNTKILPLAVDVADPSPGLGWRGAERKPLDDRGAPDLTLCLALVHHLAITRNVPLAELLEWLRSLGGALVIEFVDRDDPMAQRLLARKPRGIHDDYRRETFEQLLEQTFLVERTERLFGGDRVLYLARARA